MPVRKPAQHGKNIIGFFPSLKEKRSLAFESLVERDAFCLLDYDLLVTHFEEQPLSISYLFGGKVHVYTPDIWVVRVGKNILVECKPEDFVDTAENRVKFAAAREWCPDNGYHFEVYVAEVLRAGYRLMNINLMTMYARHVVPNDFQAEASACLAHGERPICDLAKLYKGDGKMVFAWLLCLAFHHDFELAVNDGPINDNSIIRLGGAK